VSATPTTKSRLLEQIDAARASWDALLAELGNERLEEPGVTGDWTLKDVIAHLNGWRDLTVARLEAAVRGEAPPHLWPSGLDEDAPGGVEAINQWMHERDRDLPAAEVIAKSRDQLQRMHAAVEALPEADLLEPGHYTWLGHWPLSAVVDGSLEHLQVDHEPEIRAWLANDRSPGLPSGA
jgi:hypothetical protein